MKGRSGARQGRRACTHGRVAVRSSVRDSICARPRPGLNRARSRPPFGVLTWTCRVGVATSFWCRDLAEIGLDNPWSRHEIHVVTWGRRFFVVTCIWHCEEVGCPRGISASRPTFGVATWLGWAWGRDQKLRSQPEVGIATWLSWRPVFGVVEGRWPLASRPRFLVGTWPVVGGVATSFCGRDLA